MTSLILQLLFLLCCRNVSTFVFHNIIQQITKKCLLKSSSGISSTTASLDNLEVLNKDSYLKCNPELDLSLTRMLENLSNCSVSKLNSNMELIILAESITECESIESSQRFIYVRYFYPQLLECIRSTKRVVLVSNPGTGKSIFQFYYLARLLNPAAFEDPLPPDSSGSSSIPEVVIRQIGVGEMQVFFLKAKIAHLIQPVNKRVLRCFDPKTTLYLFEPAESRVEPMWKGIDMDIFCTCSPDEIRYKEFLKNRGIKLYMPLFTIDELKTIGRHMRKQPNFPMELKKYYSDTGISMSYNEYGGIIRHVLPTSLRYVNSVKKMKEDAFAIVDWRQYIMTKPKIERSDFSHFIVKYVVNPPNFDDVSFELVNEEVKIKIEQFLKQLTLADQITLLKSSSNSLIEPSKRLIYEEVISSKLVSGCRWILLESIDRRFKTMEYNASMSYSPTLTKCLEAEVEFNNMEMNVLYKPQNKQFPFCEFYYITKINESLTSDSFITVKNTKKIKFQIPNVKLVAINTCFGLSESSKRRTFDTFLKFNETVKLPEKIQVDFLFCPHPSVANMAKGTVKRTNISDFTMIKLYILKIPLSFDSSF